MTIGCPSGKGWELWQWQSVDTTKSLEAELSSKMIKKTKLKPLRAQLSVLQTLVTLLLEGMAMQVRRMWTCPGLGKCKTCEAFNRKTRNTCGWCNAPMAILIQAPSTKNNPWSSTDRCPPGKGKGKGKGKYGVKGNGKAESYGNGNQWIQPSHLRQNSLLR